MTPHEKLGRYLEGQGLKLTPERREILEAVLGHTRHFNAESLYLTMRKQGNSVSQATVYRCLDLLVRAGIIVISCLGRDQSVYEIVRPEKAGHGHLVCLECGKIEEFDSQAVRAAVEAACGEVEFERLRQCFQIFGRCKECLALGGISKLGEPVLAEAE